MQTWPSSVNKKPMYPYDLKMETPTIENNTDVGAPKRRRRTSKNIITHSFYMKFTHAEWDNLVAWINNTLGGGVLTFGFPNPRTLTTTEMRFLLNENMWYSDFGYSETGVIVQFNMQEV